MTLAKLHDGFDHSFASAMLIGCAYLTMVIVGFGACLVVLDLVKRYAPSLGAHGQLAVAGLALFGGTIGTGRLIGKPMERFARRWHASRARKPRKGFRDFR